MRGVLIIAALLGTAAPSPIRFTFRPIPFRLDSCESARKYAPESMAGGLAVFDYNNDGRPDIFFTNGADLGTLRKTSAKYWNRMFRNDGEGRFTDVTAEAGLAGTGYDTGAAVGDFDNDGHRDLFVGGVHRNTLYRNNGNGTFSDVTARAGITATDAEHGPLWSVGGAWLDANNDGRLDLFVVNYLSWNRDKEPLCEFEGQPEYCHPKFYKELPNQLYLNRGDGTFADVSREWGLRAHLGKGMGAAVADYNGDGMPDVFVANDKLFNFLFRNAGGKFIESGFDAGAAMAEHGNLISGMGVDFRDLDNDGAPDISVVALNDETFPVYRNNGKGGFEEITYRSGLGALTRPMSGYSPNIGDFDNDGWKDVFVSRGHVQSPAMRRRLAIDEPNTVLRNVAGKWQALTAEAGFDSHAARHRGAAIADFDSDGRLDIVVSALSAPAELWMNAGTATGNWIAFTLTGTRSNRDGIGARIEVVADGRRLFDHMSTAAGYASSSARPVHFGIGAATRAERVVIRWPSGAVQELRDLTAGRVHAISEPPRDPAAPSR